MEKLKYSYQSPSVSSATSSHRTRTNRLKSPVLSDYDYVGRLVTRERPILRKSKSIQQKLVFPQNKQKFYHTMASDCREVYDDVRVSSSDDDSDGLSKPLGVIRISDRHFREIYRLPTPPPKVKRVYHRLKSPEPKVIERVFVRRPPPQIIENIIEIPPEKVRIIHKEKYLGKSTPITRSKIVRLQSRERRQREEEDEQQQQQQQHQTFTPFEQYSQQEQEQSVTIPSTTFEQPASTTLVYPPQPNMRTVGYIESTVPPHVMFNSKNPLQIPAHQVSNDPMMQPTPYDLSLQQTSIHQMGQPTPYNPSLQQTSIHQMGQPTPYNPSLQQTSIHQMGQPTPYNPLLQQTSMHQMGQPTPYNPLLQQTSMHQMGQPASYNSSLQQTPIPYMSQPTPYNYPSQQTSIHQMGQLTPFNYRPQ
ncbi:unnamed protein product [Rotaria sp. Silwood2]|nr:unnamed protein product [Rotaria sp. Silwood2]CAF3034360.1 unnamed protein product [Rotaria sp. Silwood2]CAF3979439.1 unnamed protein product [Rotaria sp. Silwood2]